MTHPISSIRNLGPATEAQFAKAGIVTAGQLRALGAHEAYRKWLEAGCLFVAVGSDIGLLARGAEALLAKFKATN